VAALVVAGGLIGAAWSATPASAAFFCGFTQVTNASDVDHFSSDPDVSADGSVVVFASFANLTGENADHSQEVFTYEPFTGDYDQRTTTTSAGPAQGAFQPTISNDGSTIAYATADNVAGVNPIHVQDLGTGTVTPVTPTPATGGYTATQLQHPALDGDGSVLAYRVAMNNGITFTTVPWVDDLDVAGTGASAYAETIQGNAQDLSLSDDGSVLAFSTTALLTGTNPSNGYEVYIQPLPSGTLERVTDATPSSNGSSLSADGDLVTFASYGGNFAGQNADATVEIFTYDVSSNTFDQITSTTTSGHYLPSLAPDRSTISYSSDSPVAGNEDGSFEILLHDLTFDVDDQLTDIDDPEYADVSATSNERTDTDAPVVVFVSDANLDFDNAEGTTEIFLWTCELPNACQLNEQVFSDVASSHPFYDDICWMNEEGISEGYAGSPLPSYKPSAAVTRQAMSAFMHRLAGFDTTLPGSPSFTDVGSSHPFSEDIEWMSATEVSTGYPPGPTYRPNAPVTRQAMSAFMHRLAGDDPVTLPGSPSFADVPFSHPFSEDVEWMAAEEISTGYPGTPVTYRPNDPVTRQAMSAFMHRLADGPGVGITP
jgi:hypothetical protein